MNAVDFLLVNNTLSSSMLMFIRIAYGLLLFLTLSSLLPNSQFYFRSERWGGYSQSSKRNDFLQNPVCSNVLLAVWFACSFCFMAGICILPAAILNLAICHYFCISMRWQCLSRGLGAPGFISHWLALAVLLTETTNNYATRIAPLALLTIQVDFALIMLSAGLYKMKAGYRHNEGMEYGMVNPQWGYWVSFFKDNFAPSHPLFLCLNHLAWSLEVLASILMLVPGTRLIGAAIILLSFAFITTQIRLGVLCEMVMLCCFYFATKGSIIDNVLSKLIPPLPTFTVSVPELELALGIALVAYLILTPLAHAGLYFNLFQKKALPKIFQVCLEHYTNMFGIIIWRVFSADLTNFFIRVHCHTQDKPYDSGTLVTKWGWRGSFRFNHVCESITLTSLFTTRKYYPDNFAMFESRLVRYARTLPCPKGNILTFEFVSVSKKSERFAHETVALFAVDPREALVIETPIDESFSACAPHAHSPVSAGVRPGTYVPINR